MQKKIIALAVAGLVSGAAFAQSNVTIYGIVDAGYAYGSDNFDKDANSVHSVIDGGQDGSRVGFKGTEDLGNGLKVSFVLEQSFSTDIAQIGGRNSNLALSGNWGTVKAGSFGSVHDDYNGYSEAGGMGWGNGALGMLTTGDARNAVEYISPNFSGLEFKVGVSTQYNAGNDNEYVDYDESDENNRAIFGSVAYANGPLKVAFTIDRSKFQTAPDGMNAASEWLLGGSYNFGPVALGAGYDRSRMDNDDVKKTWRINIGAPITANDTIALSYSRSKYDFDAGDSDKARGWGASYSHTLSKRTNVYASYGSISQSSDNTVVWGLGGEGDAQYQKAFKVGVRHFF